MHVSPVKHWWMTNEVETIVEGHIHMKQLQLQSVSVDHRTGSDWMSIKKNHFHYMKLQKSFRYKTANYSILCESYLHQCSCENQLLHTLLYRMTFRYHFMSAVRLFPAVCWQKKEKSSISLSVSKEWTSIKSYEDFFGRSISRVIWSAVRL